MQVLTAISTPSCTLVLHVSRSICLLGGEPIPNLLQASSTLRSHLLQLSDLYCLCVQPTTAKPQVVGQHKFMLHVSWLYGGHVLARTCHFGSSMAWPIVAAWDHMGLYVILAVFSPPTHPSSYPALRCCSLVLGMFLVWEWCRREDRRKESFWQQQNLTL